MSDASFFISSRPDDVAVPCAPGQTLLDALVAAGVPIARACGGKARCTTCRVRLEAGAGEVSARTAEEAALAERLHFDPATRLACQAVVNGALSVRRLVLDDEDATLAARSLDPARPGSVGREARVSLLFADVAGFTALSALLPPYDVIHLLNRWFGRAGRAVESAGGRIDNYMGDGLLAVFGGDDHELAAVRGGLGLLDAAEAVSAYTEPLYGEAFSVRVGIHAGAVVLGDLGASHNRRESVIGADVNLASRVEAANKAAGTRLLVSRPVREAVGDRAVIGRVVRTELRGAAGTHELTEIVRLV